MAYFLSTLSSFTHTTNNILKALCDKSLHQNNAQCIVPKCSRPSQKLCKFCGNKACAAHLLKKRKDPSQPTKRHDICYLCDKYYIEQMLHDELNEEYNSLQKTGEHLRKRIGRKKVQLEAIQKQVQEKQLQYQQLNKETTDRETLLEKQFEQLRMENSIADQHISQCQQFTQTQELQNNKIKEENKELEEQLKEQKSQNEKIAQKLNEIYSSRQALKSQIESLQQSLKSTKRWSNQFNFNKFKEQQSQRQFHINANQLSYQSPKKIVHANESVCGGIWGCFRS